MNGELKLEEGSPSVSGILSGTCKGKVWEFHEEGTSLGVAYSYCVGGCGVVGKIGTNHKAIRAFFEEVFDSLRVTGINEFEFSTEDKELCKKLINY